ncbi:hypothetical protein C0Q44_14995 [Paenibacillus sp. PCH8]|uniref:hypothetical protein n=1 Tax=Paenibacillus sp. PCH8 TaxID=2066524 RepID=UPI000CF942EB|nr:hypothetical protein [Paenibacillus sp. PCH8]PQP82708.1 hypothetical protein C0Q44_14995 [Paenibacillus sp. PCH8]
MEINLVRLLNSIGKRVFVEYYEVFSNNKMSKDEKIAKLPEEYKIDGSRIRVNCANKIFESGLEKKALNIIVNSRTEKKAIEKAKTLLKNM